MRNKILTTALLVILPFLATACSLQELPVIGKYFTKMPSLPGKESTVTVWGMWENPEVMEALILKFNETNPNIKVNYEDRSVLRADQHRQSVFTRISTDAEPPADVILVHNSWMPTIKPYLAPAPKDFMDIANYASAFYPSAVENGIFDGSIYAVPAYYDGLALIYNINHFQEVDQQTAPTAWEEFRRLALNLTKRDKDGKAIRAGAAMGLASNVEFFPDIVGMMFAQAGVLVPQDLEKTSAQDAFKFYVAFATEDGVWNESFPESATAFAQEKVSMIFAPSWVLLDIIKVRPDLNIGVAPVPQAISNAPVSWGSFWMYTVPQKSTNQASAWEFIKYLSSDEAQLLMFSTATQFRTYGAPYASVGLREQASSGTASMYLKPYLDTASFSKSGVFSARAGNTNTVEALKSAIDSMTGPNVSNRSSAIDALKAVKSKISK